jgi:hypothetical protein
LIPTRRRHTDSQGRRRDLGASIKEMAAGLGMSVADILDIEKGVAMDSRVTHCRVAQDGNLVRREARTRVASR